MKKPIVVKVVQEQRIRAGRLQWLKRVLDRMLSRDELHDYDVERTAIYTLGLLPTESALRVIDHWCNETNAGYLMRKKPARWRQSPIKQRADRNERGEEEA